MLHFVLDWPTHLGPFVVEELLAVLLEPGSNRFRLPFQSVSESYNFILFTN